MVKLCKNDAVASTSRVRFVCGEGGRGSMKYIEINLIHRVEFTSMRSTQEDLPTREES